MFVSFDITPNGILVGASWEFAPLGDEVHLCISSMHAYAASAATHAADELATLSGSGSWRNRYVDSRERSSPRESMPLRSCERDSTGMNRAIPHLVLMLNFKRAAASVLRGGSEPPPPPEDDEIELPDDVFKALQDIVLPNSWDLEFLIPQWTENTVQAYQEHAAARAQEPPSAQDATRRLSVGQTNPRDYSVTDESLRTFIKDNIWPQHQPDVARQYAEQAFKQAEYEEKQAILKLNELFREVYKETLKAKTIAEYPEKPPDLENMKPADMNEDQLKQYKEYRLLYCCAQAKARTARKAANKMLAKLEKDRIAFVEERAKWSCRKLSLHRIAVEQLNKFFRDWEREHPQDPNDPTNLPGTSGSGQQRGTKRGADSGAPPGPEKKDKRCLIM